jgi:DNA-binding beta-propeller fold protein YncE
VNRGLGARRVARGVVVPCIVGLLSACGGGGGSPGDTTLRQMGGSLQGKPLVLAGAVTTVAGSALVEGSADGTTAARFKTPYAITTDGANLYVADSNNHTIRKVVISTGAVTTVAGSAGTAGSTDGTSAARFNFPDAIATDGANLYVADTFNHTIRMVVISTGAVTTLAGSAGVFGSTDGTAGARFSFPHGLTTDGPNLYVADSGNSTIRKIVITTGTVSTVAGTAGVSGSTDGSSARFNSPQGITTDGVNLYVADTQNNTIRKILISSGVVSTLAGSTGIIGSTDGTAAARFWLPYGITTDGTNLYVADSANQTIRRIVSATGVVTTVAGSAGVSGSADGTAAARFYNPFGITSDGASLYVADSLNSTIRKVQ